MSNYVTFTTPESDSAAPSKLAIRPWEIESFEQFEGDSGTYLFIGDGDAVYVTESLDQVLALLNNTKGI